MFLPVTTARDSKKGIIHAGHNLFFFVPGNNANRFFVSDAHLEIFSWLPYLDILSYNGVKQMLKYRYIFFGYRAHANITHSLYILNPLFEGQKRLFEFFLS